MAYTLGYSHLSSHSRLDLRLLPIERRDQAGQAYRILNQKLDC